MNNIANLLWKIAELSAAPIFIVISAAAAFVLFYAWKRTPWRAITFSIGFPGFVGFLGVNLGMNMRYFEFSIGQIFGVLASLYFCLFYPSFFVGFFVVLKSARDAFKNKEDYKPTFVLFLFLAFQLLCIAGTLYVDAHDKEGF